MNQVTHVKVWDPLVRLFHWGLVASFTLAYLSEDDWMDLHVYAGYTLLGLKTFFTAGPKEARAWTFPDGAKAPQAGAIGMIVSLVLPAVGLVLPGKAESTA